MGIDQQMWLRGPVSVDPPAPFLYNVSNILVTLKGNPINQLIANATIGGGNFPISPLEWIYNPLNLDVTQSNVQFDIIQDPLPLNSSYGTNQFGYTAFDTNLLATPYSCPASDNAGTVGLKNGVTKITLKANSWQTITLDSTTGVNYCEGYMAVATCCGLVFGNFTGVQGTLNFTTTVSGHFDVNVQNFTFTQTYRQTNIPISCVGTTATWESLCITAPYNLVSGYCLKTEKGLFCNQPYYNGTTDESESANPRKPLSIIN